MPVSVVCLLRTRIDASLYIDTHMTIEIAVKKTVFFFVVCLTHRYSRLARATFNFDGHTQKKKYKNNTHTQKNSLTDNIQNG